jgi:hypothetical protein
LGNAHNPTGDANYPTGRPHIILQVLSDWPGQYLIVTTLALAVLTITFRSYFSRHPIALLKLGWAMFAALLLYFFTFERSIPDVLARYSFNKKLYKLAKSEGFYASELDSYLVENKHHEWFRVVFEDDEVYISPVGILTTPKNQIKPILKLRDASFAEKDSNLKIFLDRNGMAVTDRFVTCYDPNQRKAKYYQRDFFEITGGDPWQSNSTSYSRSDENPELLCKKDTHDDGV